MAPPRRAFLRVGAGLAAVGAVAGGGYLLYRPANDRQLVFATVADAMREVERLASAADTYRPSLGETAIPQRIAALDGAWISIDGYVAFPLGGEAATEILVMLNQWDGCCIGVPPTPYDAIEVALANPVPRSQRHAISFGTLTGRLQVSPYLVESWLVGLYLMDDAEIKLEL